MIRVRAFLAAIGAAILYAVAVRRHRPARAASPRPEVFGTCLDCADSSTAFPEVVRRLENGRCSVCGSESIVRVHTADTASDSRFLRGQRWTTERA